MNLKNLEVSNEIRRLHGRTEARAAGTGFSVLGTYAFASPFLLAGIGITLVGLKIIPVAPAGVNAPFWVLTVIGVVFTCAGLTVFGMGVKQHLRKQRLAALSRQQPENQAIKDHPWNPAGYKPGRWTAMFKAMTGAIVFTLFLAIFNYFVFFTKTPLFPKVIIGLFDLILLFVWGQTIMIVWRAFKFGNTILEFSEFPYRLGQPVILRWRTDSNITGPIQAKFTLRCVEEWYEHRGTIRSKNHRIILIHEEKWSATWHGERSRPLFPGERIELRFEPPLELPSSKLNSKRPVFWELEVYFDLPGADFKQTYLVPVYAEEPA